VHVAIVVYLIGPSSVGKSTAAAYLQDAGEATWRDLDAWMQQAGFPSRDWPPIAPLFAELEASADTLPVIVDIGAGHQYMECDYGDSGLRDWLSERSSRVIVVAADPSEVCARNQYHRNLGSFLACEYAPERRALYAIAGTQVVVTGMTKEASVAAVADAFRRVVLNQGTIEASRRPDLMNCLASGPPPRSPRASRITPQRRYAILASGSGALSGTHGNRTRAEGRIRPE